MLESISGQLCCLFLLHSNDTMKCRKPEMWKTVTIWKLLGTCDYSLGLGVRVLYNVKPRMCAFKLICCTAFQMLSFHLYFNILHFSEKFLGVTGILVILSVYAVKPLLIYPNSCKMIESFEVVVSFTKCWGLFSDILPLCFSLQTWSLKFTFLYLSPSLSGIYFLFFCCQDTIQSSN